MPPLACNVCEYAVPTVPVGRLEVVTTRAVGFTVMLSFAVAVSGVLSESFTSIVKLEPPLAVGVPEMTPEPAANERPPGRLPALTLQV
jgi:hypothetical protein